MNRKANEAEGTKGWKINLTPYKHEVGQFLDNGRPALKNGEQIKKPEDFDVKETLAGMCFNRDLMLDAESMFKAKDIADKIRGAKNSVVLDNEQMEHIRKAYKLLKGLPEDFIEFLSRIRDAEEIALKEVTTEE